MNGLMTYLAGLFTGLSLIQIMAFVAVCLVAAGLLKAHFDETNPFNIKYLIVDEVTGLVSSYKFAFMVVLVAMTYGFVTLLNQGKMTEAYAGLYAGTFVAGRIFGKDRVPPKKDE